MCSAVPGITFMFEQQKLLPSCSSIANNVRHVLHPCHYAPIQTPRCRLSLVCTRCIHKKIAHNNSIKSALTFISANRSSSCSASVFEAITDFYLFFAFLTSDFEVGWFESAANNRQDNSHSSLLTPRGGSSSDR